MKHLKIFILTISLLTVFNCSSDDDASADSPEPTIQEKLSHRWNLLTVEDAITGEQVVLSICEKRTYYQFSLNNEAQLELFNTDDDDNCISGGLINGTYEILQVDGENGVNIITDTGNEIYKIISVTETELIFEQIGFGVRHFIFIRA